MVKHPVSPKGTFFKSINKFYEYKKVVLSVLAGSRRFGEKIIFGLGKFSREILENVFFEKYEKKLSEWVFFALGARKVFPWNIKFFKFRARKFHSLKYKKNLLLEKYKKFFQSGFFFFKSARKSGPDSPWFHYINFVCSGEKIMNLQKASKRCEHDCSLIGY